MANVTLAFDSKEGLDGFDQHYQASSPTCWRLITTTSKNWDRIILPIMMRTNNLLEMPRVKPNAAGWEARMLTIALCGPPMADKTLKLLGEFLQCIMARSISKQTRIIFSNVSMNKFPLKFAFVGQDINIQTSFFIKMDVISLGVVFIMKLCFLPHC